MTEENRPEGEKARQALGEFLDRLAKAVAEGLARTKSDDRPGRLPGRPRDGGTKSKE